MNKQYGSIYSYVYFLGLKVSLPVTEINSIAYIYSENYSNLYFFMVNNEGKYRLLIRIVFGAFLGEYNFAPPFRSRPFLPRGEILTSRWRALISRDFCSRH